MQRPVAIDPISPFRDPETAIGVLSARAGSLAVVAASDMALALDNDGVIVDIAHNGAELARDGCAEWIGRRWLDTVADDSTPKVAEMLAQAHDGVTPSPARQVNHLTPRGTELPMRYTVVRIGPHRLLALGRELRAISALQNRLVEAQHASEREYARLRDAEMRYRLLYQMAGEALLIVDTASRRVTEANPAAERLLAAGARKVMGRPFTALFAPENAGDLDRLANRARAAGRADPIAAQLPDGQRVSVSAAMFRQDVSTFLLLRIHGAEAASAPSPGDSALTAASVLAAAPEAYVVTDGEGIVRHLNTAFLNLAQLATEEQAVGASLERFLGRPGVDLFILLSSLRENDSVRHFATSLRGEFGSVVDVEIVAARVDAGDESLFGFLIRSVEARPAAKGDGGLPRSVEQLTELVGRVPLKDLVRETTDVIERLCIEAALELTGDNRASAADMLGLSRQSLYVKLRRYGLGDLDDPDG